MFGQFYKVTILIHELLVKTIKRWFKFPVWPRPCWLLAVVCCGCQHSSEIWEGVSQESQSLSLCRLWLRGKCLQTGSRALSPCTCVLSQSSSQICKLGGGSHNLSRLNCPLSHFSSSSAVILSSHKMMSSLSVSNLPDCCVMILSCETVKCPVNLQQIPDKCWHMISSSSRPSRQIATSWEQRFLTDGFYLWAEHQSSECLEPAIRLSSIISMRRGSEIVFWLKCRICPVGMALSVLSLVTERIAGPGPDHSTHEDWSELGLTRTQITRYLQIFSLLQSCPRPAPLSTSIQIMMIDLTTARLPSMVL